MRELIACCGLDCEKCEARKATLMNDDKLREKVAQDWSALNHVLITTEMIHSRHPILLCTIGYESRNGGSS